MTNTLFLQNAKFTSGNNCPEGESSCFTGDTLVATEDGQKRIDEIKLGDKVWAYNVETGETELKEVTKIYIHEVDKILHLHTSVGDIDTTSNHPFYVIDKGWVAAGDLDIGDKVYQLDGSTAIVIGSEYEKLDIPVKVYNLEVEDFHSYFVGDSPVLVHNYETDLNNLSENKINHIINGSEGSNHNWDKLVPDKNWNAIRDIIEDVIKTGNSVPYKTIDSIVKNVNGYDVQVVYKIVDSIMRISNAWVMF